MSDTIAPLTPEERRKAAQAMVAERLRTLAAAVADLAIDLHRPFPRASSACDFASENLIEAAMIVEAGRP
jgi:hypothetical protein